MNYVIGGGGGGSILLPILARMVKPEEITVIDGDVLEPKNLDRQLFRESDIGRNKAEALSELHGVLFEPKWYSAGLFQHTRYDWVFGCADNHPARAAILSACDMSGCRAIIAGNETTSSEAYYYQPDWRDGPMDPRVYYPEIMTDHSGDPLARSAGCTGDAQKANPQLVTANLMAAALAMHLYVLWAISYRKLDKEVRPFIPHRMFQNLTKSGQFTEVSLKGQTQ